MGMSKRAYDATFVLHCGLKTWSLCHWCNSKEEGGTKHGRLKQKKWGRGGAPNLRGVGAVRLIVRKILQTAVHRREVLSVHVSCPRHADGGRKREGGGG